jgi:hypothetical protein
MQHKKDNLLNRFLKKEEAMYVTQVLNSHFGKSCEIRISSGRMYFCITFERYGSTHLVSDSLIKIAKEYIEQHKPKYKSTIKTTAQMRKF